MLVAMVLSIAFIVLDVLSVTSVLNSVLPVGINPFWKLSFVFKCLTDSVVLDDFKTALDRLRAFKISRLGSFAIDTNDNRVKEHANHLARANNWDEPIDPGRAIPIGELPPIIPTSELKGLDAITKQAELSSVEEREYAGITRLASRDRDVEENSPQAIDYENLNRQASLAPMLDRHSKISSDDDSDIASEDMDSYYAQAVREITHDDTKPRTGNGMGKEM